MKDYTGRCIGCDARCIDDDYCHGCHVYVCEGCEVNPQKRVGQHSPTDHLDCEALGEVN